MKRAREIGLALLGLVALSIGAFFVSPRTSSEEAGAADRERLFTGSTFDAGPHGAKGLYLVLAALGHAVERRTRPGTPIPGERVRIVLGPRVALDAPTLAWVARGNTLVVAPPPPGHTPGHRVHGDGRVFAISAASALENAALRRDPAPAVRLAAICAAYSYGGSVVFDESPPVGSFIAALWSFPAGMALLQALAAVLVLAWAMGPRFGAVVTAPRGTEPPAATEQVAAIADLYERAEAAPLAAQLLRTHFRQRATQALGLSPAADDATVAAQFCRRYGGASSRLADYLDAATRRLRPRELARLARGLHEYEERMHGTRGTRA